MSDIAIKVENLSKTFRIPKERRITVKDGFLNLLKPIGYQEFVALDGVSFEVKKGGSLGIIGPNGSGKSTLLKILASIYSPDYGKIEINGRVLSFLELGVGFNPDLSGYENIYLNGVILGLSRKYISEKLNDIVSFSGINRKFLDTPIRHYSSGMQLRLAFAVAVYVDADVYIMDEVLSVGDKEFQKKSKKVFDDLRKSGKTLILVSHDANQVERFCDRVILLDNGRKRLEGTAKEVFSSYDGLKSDEDRDMIISVHIPKAGGTTLKNYLSDAFGEGVCFDYDDNSPSSPDFMPYRSEDINKADRGTRCIHGHFLADKYDAVYQDAKLITWLRHPVDRVVSQYYFWKRNPEMRSSHPTCEKLFSEDLSLEEFALLPELKNFYIRHLASKKLNDFAFVGITERFDVSIKILNTVLGIENPPVIRVDNVNKEKRHSDNYSIDAGLRSKIEDHNKEDMILYYQACLTLEKMVKQLDN